MRSRWFFILWFFVLAAYFASGLWWRTFKVWQYPVTSLHQTLEKSGPWENALKPIEAKELRGRIVLIHFWNHCCKTCRTFPASFKRVQEKFESKVTVLGVYLRPAKGLCSEVPLSTSAKEFGVSYPMVEDKDGSLSAAFRVEQPPAVILINPDGKIEASGFGYVSYDQMEYSLFTVQKKFLDYRM